MRALPSHRAGGLELHTQDLANELVRRGHQVTLITTPGADRPASLHTSLQLRCIAGAKPADYSITFWNNLPSAVAEEERANGKFDIIHTQEFAGFFPAKIWKGRWVATVHGTLTTETPLHPRYWKRLNLRERLAAAWRFKHRLPMFPLFGRMVEGADAIITDSQFTRNELLAQKPHLASRIEVVPLGVDLQRYDLANDRRAVNSGPVVVGLLGRMDEMKGVGIALQVASRLAAEGVSFRMEIAGTGPYAGQAARRIAHAGLDHQIRLLGRLDSDKEVSRFLGNCDVFLFPDLTQPAFGLVAVEAMAHGLPVVAARSGAIPEVVTEETGWLYEPWDLDQLTAILRHIVENRASLLEKKEAARQRAALYTVSAMAEKTEAVYRRVSPAN